LSLVRLLLAAGLTLVSTSVASLSENAFADEWGSLDLMGQTIPPGEKLKFTFLEDRSFEGSYIDPPIFVARGLRAGSTLCVTAGVHGDEINGVEIARRAFEEADPQKLAGTLIVLPAINIEGFRTGSRYLSDRRDLNRHFPGNPDGSIASIIANAVFSNVIKQCSALVDLHTGSFRRSNVPQVRVDLSNPEATALAIHFGVGYIVNGSGPKKSLRREAMDAGIPAIIYEAGEPMRFQTEEISRGVLGIANVMAYLEMNELEENEVPESNIYRGGRWVRVGARNGGFFFPERELGTEVTKGDRLGIVIDPLTDERHEIIAPFKGDIIGMAFPQVVLSGYAVFHLGLHHSETPTESAEGGSH
jgi:uncharacterized protein